MRRPPFVFFPVKEWTFGVQEPFKLKNQFGTGGDRTIEGGR